LKWLEEKKGVALCHPCIIFKSHKGNDFMNYDIFILSV